MSPCRDASSRGSRDGVPKADVVPNYFTGIVGVGDPDSSCDGSTDGVVVQLATDGVSLIYGTYIGGGVSMNDRVVGMRMKATAPSQPSLVRLRVFDGCGPWSTFVGGGAGSY